MLKVVRSTVALAAFMVAGSAVQAVAKPDLSIRDVQIDEASISCAKRDPLVKVVVFVENLGTEKADFGFRRSIVGVSADNAPFTYKFVSTANDVDPGEVARFVVEVGKGAEKKGRIGRVTEGGEPFVPRSAREQNRLPRSLKLRIQEELRGEGYYRGPIDGDLGRGSRAAISAFQRDRGDRATGVLTLAQTEDLLEGGRSRSSYFGTVREFSIVVVVDPNSRIDESDEGNNTEVFGPFELENC